MENKTIPYIAYELEQAKHERTVRRLLLALMITITLMFLSNLAWLYVWSSYDYEEESKIEVNSENGNGIANYVGRDGSINNG